MAAPTGGDHRGQIEVGRSPVGCGQLRLGQRERSPELDQGHDLAPRGLDRPEWATVQGVDPSDVDRRVLPALGTREVDEAAGGQVVLERTGRLCVDLAPGLVGDRGQLSHQVVHGSVLLLCRRLPMPRLLSLAAARANGLGVGGRLG